MKTLTIETPNAGVVKNTQIPPARPAALDDDLILDLAKRRLSQKRNLISQVVEFALISSFLFFMVVSYDVDLRLFLAFIFFTFWSIRLLMRIIRFAKPSFKDGIATYFRERKERNLESEYSRLKKMRNIDVLNELNKYSDVV